MEWVIHLNEGYLKLCLLNLSLKDDKDRNKSHVFFCKYLYLEQSFNSLGESLMRLCIHNLKARVKASFFTSSKHTDEKVSDISRF